MVLAEHGIMRINDAVSHAVILEICSKILQRDPKYPDTWTAQYPAFIDPYGQAEASLYYGREAKRRNKPLIQQIYTSEQLAQHPNGRYHVDHLHQVSMMLLLSTVTEQTTHMQYAIGSHKGLKLEGYYDENQVHSRYSILDLIGEPGTVYIFDTAGIHRAKYIVGTRRKILHLNFTTGHDLAV